MSSYTRQQLESWLKTIKINKGSKVLDIGGSQLPVKSRLGNKEEDTFFEILDLVEPHEVKTTPDIISDLNKPIYIEERQFYYDVAFCLEVMEYIYNPVQALENINFFLQKNGVLFISTPFIYPVHNPKEQDCLRYTEFGIKKLLDITGFEILDIESRATRHPDLLRSFFVVEGMKPSKEYEAHDSVGHLITARKI